MQLWNEWKAKNEDLMAPDLSDGFPYFLREALSGYSRVVGVAKRELDRRGFVVSARQEWNLMPPHQQLLWAAQAAYHSLKPVINDRPPMKRRRIRGSTLPLLPNGWKPPELVDGGSDKIFADPWIKQLLCHARRRVSFSMDWVFCIRTFGRSGANLETGGKKAGIMDLTLNMLKERGLLDDETFLQRLHIFVAHDDPHYKTGCYKKALGSLANRIIVGVRGADLQVRFIEECFLPGQHIVVADDNILTLEEAPKPEGSEAVELKSTNLEHLVLKAAKLMQQHGGHLWSINPCHNKMYLCSASECQLRLGLSYGALFGFIALHDKELYTQHGQVKDDLERSVRYFHRDRIIIRFGRVGCKKNFTPGVFNKHKGGISASLGSEQKHKEESQQALQKLVEKFDRYIRMPGPEDLKKEKEGQGKSKGDASVKQFNSRVSKCGVVFLWNMQHSHGEVPKDKALMAGFLCEQCRHIENRLHLPGCTCVRPNYEEARKLFQADHKDQGIEEINRRFEAMKKDPKQSAYYQRQASLQLEKTQWKTHGTMKTGKRGPKPKPKAPRASSVLAQDLSRLEGLGGALDASKPLGRVEPGHAFTAFLKEEAKEPKAQVNDEHPVGTRVVQPIMEFGYREHFSEACAYCNRFHVIIKCPEALAEATKENVIVKFEQKEFWLTIRGQSKDFGLRRCIGQKTSLPVTFKVCPERCAVIVSPGKKVELIMKPALPSSFQPGRRVKLERLQSKDALQLNGQSGTIESYVDSEVTAVRYVVRLDDGQKLRVRPQNMRILEKQI
eukprot:symbB.v1.2.021826.t1/scaffold1881.1/size97231/4